MIEIAGYLSAIVIGISLGLLGGGGSILTVPAMVYLFGISPVLATAYSLFVVGVSSGVGALRKRHENLVAVNIGLIFAIPSLIAVFLTRYYVIPMLPENLFTVGNMVITKDLFILIFFAIVMLLASFSMIRGRKGLEEHHDTDKPINVPLIILEGLIVGAVTGFVGAGGGFLIVPALVLLVNLPMKTAVGTSLMIIAIKSTIGFLGDLGAGQHIDWMFLIGFTILTLIGMAIGIYLTRFVSANKLKVGFGWFVLIFGIFILLKELLNF